MLKQIVGDEKKKTNNARNFKLVLKFNVSNF